MDPAAARVPAPPPIVFHDGLGERRGLTSATGRESLEVLCLRQELSAVPSFEFALRERVSRLSAFRHAYYATVRSVERLPDPGATLALVSDRTDGIRLFDLLAAAERYHLTFDVNAALYLIRQLVPAIAVLHEQAHDIGIGAIAPERLIVTPYARLVVVEHVLGAALEQLRFSHERYWKDLRIALPRCAGLPRFDARADVMQVGAVALALILGRPLADDETPSKLGDVLGSAWAMSARGGLEPLPAGLRSWLAKALQVDLRDAFPTAVEARDALEQVLADTDYLVTPTALTDFLDRYREAEAANASEAEPAPPVKVATPERAAAPKPLDPAPSTDPARVRTAANATHADTAQPKPAPARAKPEPAQREPERVHAKPVIPPFASSLEPDEDDDPDADEPEAPRQWIRIVAAAGVLMAFVGGGVFTARHFMAAGPIAATTGTVVVNTDPEGAALSVDGAAKGVTPQTLTLAAGAHVLELGTGGDARRIPLTVAAGAQLTQYFELPKATPDRGQLQVRTEPAGARVAVDGVARGTSPVTVADLQPGEHIVDVSSDLGSVRHTVTVDRGATASIVIPLAAADGAPVSGWVAVTAPLDVQVFEGGRLIGSSQTDRIMMGAGTHQLEFVNESIGYRQTRAVQVTAGKVTALPVKLPNGTIAINAVPWAEVWIDGVKAGETPIGNLSITAGQHEIVFRHPDLGEQHQVATVTLIAPLRLSVDLRKK